MLFFSEGLAEEVKGLAPGPTETNFAATADMLKTRLFRMGALSAQQVARAGYRGFRRGRVLVIPGWRNKLGVLAVRLLPRAVVRQATAYLQE